MIPCAMLKPLTYFLLLMGVICAGPATAQIRHLECGAGYCKPAPSPFSGARPSTYDGLSVKDVFENFTYIIPIEADFPGRERAHGLGFAFFVRANRLAPSTGQLKCSISRINDRKPFPPKAPSEWKALFDETRGYPWVDDIKIMPREVLPQVVAGQTTWRVLTAVSSPRNYDPDKLTSTGA